MTETSILATEEKTGQRLLGIPSVARLALFARHEGPAILLTTEDRLLYFDDTGSFGARRSVDPGLADWFDRAEKVVLSLEQAV